MWPTLYQSVTKGKMRYTQTQWNGTKVIFSRSSINKTRPLRLLIGFHGAESTPENILIQGNRLRLKNTTMAFPEGFIAVDKDRFSWWKDGPKQKKTVEEFLNNCDGLIDRAHEYLKEGYPGRKIKTSLWGFSQGASAALVYALLGRNQIHKVVSVCGFLPEIPQPPADKNHRASVLGIFGTNDEVVPAFLAEHALDEMKRFGHESIVHETLQGHEISHENLLEINAFID